MPRLIGRLPSGYVDRKWRRSWVTADKKWQDAEMEPLKITAALAGPVALTVDGVIHFDSVLSAAACAAVNAGPNQTFDNVVIPLPLKLLWADASGRPLWACTDLRPDGGAPKTSAYWHRRYPVDRAALADKMPANTSAGRWKDYRVPLTLTLTDRLTAVCIGSREYIDKLLPYISHVGKKPSQGKGRILGWQVDRLDISEDDALTQIRASRPMPVDYLTQAGLGFDPATATRGAWTPPYWDATRHAEVVAWMP